MARPKKADSSQLTAVSPDPKCPNCRAEIWLVGFFTIQETRRAYEVRGAGFKPGMVVRSEPSTAHCLLCDAPLPYLVSDLMAMGDEG